MKKSKGKIISSILLSAMLAVQMSAGVFAESGIGTEMPSDPELGQIIEFDLGDEDVSGIDLLEATEENKDSQMDLSDALAIVESVNARIPHPEVGVEGICLTDEEMNAISLVNEAELGGENFNASYKASAYNHSNNYYYQQMNSSEKKLYTDLVSICNSFAASAKDVSSQALSAAAVPSGMTWDNAVQVYYAVYYSNPQFFFLIGGYGYNNAKTLIAPAIDEDFQKYSARKTMSDKIEALTTSWMNTINTLGSDLEKEKWIADSLCSRITYDLNAPYNQTIAGALGNDSCVCNGYAMSMVYFCSAVGIDCITVVSENHAWNRVKLYGNWYCVDTTWMDQTDYGFVWYDWFNKSEATFLKNDPDGDHIIDQSYYTGWTLPACVKDDVAEAPAKPVITKVTPGDGQATVTWSAVSGASQYKVYTYINNTYKAIANTTSTSYTVKGLTNGVKTGFLVRACVNNVWSDYSTADIVYATPVGASKPAKPVITKVTPGDRQATVTWSAVSGASYRVYTYINGAYKAIANTSSTSYTVKGLTNGVKTGFLVRACVNNVWSDYSTADIVYATPSGS
ncbi:MAG: hypothetical protein NC120_08970, partial [Ruminococcus sp.]|nr:hypothetical protein [Ruminococcus sp.]